MDFLQFFNFIYAIIIDNDYSRHNFIESQKRKGMEEREAYIYSCLFLFFEVEFIARYILTRNHDNVILSNLCVQHPMV